MVGYLFTSFNQKLNSFKVVNNNSNNLIYKFNIYSEDDKNNFVIDLIEKKNFQIIYKDNKTVLLKDKCNNNINIKKFEMINEKIYYEIEIDSRKILSKL